MSIKEVIKNIIILFIKTDSEIQIGTFLMK